MPSLGNLGDGGRLGDAMCIYGAILAKIISPFRGERCHDNKNSPRPCPDEANEERNQKKHEQSCESNANILQNYAKNCGGNAWQKELADRRNRATARQAVSNTKKSKRYYGEIICQIESIMKRKTASVRADVRLSSRVKKV
jgi:hypothetical protein